MRYVEPLNSAQFPDRDGKYVDAIPSQGVVGSTVPAASIEHPQREIVNVIQGAGLDPDFTNLGQLLQALTILINESALSASFGESEPDTLLGKNGGMYFQYGDYQALWEKVGGLWKKRIIIPNGDEHIGFLHMYTVNTVRRGFLFANGSQNLSRTLYDQLFALTGTTWGEGNGSTTFGIMDARGLFIRAWDGNRGIDNGREFGSVQGWAIENIVGTLRDAVFSTTTPSDTNLFSVASNSTVGSGATGTNKKSFTFDASRVVQTANETRPINTSLYACIGAY